MLESFLRIFVVVTVTFFLFFYSTPYWTGAEMEDLMDNGIYRAFFVFCSKAGYWAYQLIEWLSSKICFLLESKNRRGKDGRLHLLVYTLLSLCLLTGAVVGLNQIYEYLFREMLAVDGGINVSNEHDFSSRLSDLIIFFKLAAGHFDGTFSGFFRAIGEALVICIVYFWGTVIFFSFMFGLLRQKVIPLRQDSPAEQEPLEWNGAEGLAARCAEGVRDAVRKICYLCYFKIPGLLPIFLLLVAAYSLVQAWMGGDADVGALLSDIVGSTGVIDIAQTFLVEFIAGKLLWFIGIPIYRALPPGVREAVDEWSGKGDLWAYEELCRRNAWSDRNDFAWNAAGWHGFLPKKPYTGLRRLNLDGRR